VIIKLLLINLSIILVVGVDKLQHHDIFWFNKINIQTQQKFRGGEGIFGIFSQKPMQNEEIFQLRGKFVGWLCACSGLFLVHVD